MINNEEKEGVWKMSNMDFYKDRLKEIRENKGLTQLDIAKACGLRKQSVENWESGECKPRPKRMKQIAARLGVPVWEISSLKAEPEEKLHYPDPDCSHLCDGMKPEDISLVKKIMRLSERQKGGLEKDVDRMLQESPPVQGEFRAEPKTGTSHS